MGLQMVFEVERGYPVAHVRPRGVVDERSAPDLRAALMEGLLDQPSLLVVDLSEARAVDDAALDTVAAVAREAQVWPGARLALLGAAPDTHEALRRLGVAAFVSTFNDASTVAVAAAALRVPPRAHRRIEPTDAAPGIAREAIRELAAEQSGDADSAAAELVASELVTNAVMHAGTAIELTVRLMDECAHIAVRDENPNPARITGYVSDSDEHGRGLLLVDALAASWGAVFPGIGKIVWAAVPVPGLGGK
jgi:anti-sigma regulatory factor (Ser/Thr protein kinase)/anti-anti-sigma regulatory factor